MGFERAFKTCHEVILRDAVLVIEINKLLFALFNFRQIKKTKQEALAGFSGEILTIHL